MIGSVLSLSALLTVACSTRNLRLFRIPVALSPALAFSQRYIWGNTWELLSPFLAIMKVWIMSSVDGSRGCVPHLEDHESTRTAGSKSDENKMGFLTSRRECLTGFAFEVLRQVCIPFNLRPSRGTGESELRMYKRCFCCTVL